jgi:predicted RNase H-like HicB family nuclease
MIFTAVITQAEEGGFNALNPETGTCTQGDTYQEAVGNLKEATGLYLDEFPMTVQGHPLLTTFEIAHA